MNCTIKKFLYPFALLILLYTHSVVFSQTTNSGKSIAGLPKLSVSKQNPHYLVTNGEKPFFWLGDTAWLLFSKLTREEAVQYLEDRKQKGYNVIQIMVLHSLDGKNVYGAASIADMNVAKPITTPGNDFNKTGEYDYWDHIDFILKTAAEKGLYMALVPVWGSNVKSGKVSAEQAKKYAEFLANRYKSYSNVIWMNGGDIFGNENNDVWEAIGTTLKSNNPNHLQTFHPHGRNLSSEWFHNESWLDFNMVQSGHRRYNQDDTQRAYGEDNWRYIETDYKLKPTKPTIDGEPSYEGIPQGLHDTLQPKWNANDVRRYGYWSVFAGAMGYTYGHNAVMQMYKKTDKEAAYGNKVVWNEAINAPGASQMMYIKKLILMFPFFDRVPDQSLIANQGEKYDFLAATRGKDYALIYTYNGRKIMVNMGKITGDIVNAYWYNPRDGKRTTIGTISNTGIQEFHPPGEIKEGNDWVLILSSK
jgi:hypothetical protein